MVSHIKKPPAATLALPAGVLGALAVVGAYRVGPLIPLVFAAALAVAVTAFIRPIAVVYLAVAAVPLELYSLPVGSAIDLTVTKALLTIAAVAWVLKRLATGRLPVISDSPLTKPFGLLLLALVPGVVLASDSVAAVKVLADWTVFFFLYQLIVEDGRPQTVRNLLMALALTGAVSGVTAITATHGATPVAATGSSAPSRATAEFLSPNALGLLLAMALPSSIALAIRGPRVLRPAAAAAAVLAAVGLALTLSRGAILAALAALLLMLAWRSFRRVALVGAVAIVALAFLAPATTSRLFPVKAASERISSIPRAASGNPRWQIWRDALGQFAAHPIFGVGADNFRTRALGSQSADPQFQESSAQGVAYSRFPPHAHNIALNVLVELGLLGLVAAGWLLVRVVRLVGHACRRGRGLDQALAFGVMAALAVVFLEGLVDYPLTDYTLAALVVILAACAAVLARPGSDLPPQS